MGAGVALLSVGVLAIPASAASRSVFKTRGKELSAVVTTCPANRSNSRQRTADGSAVIDGASLPTTAIGPFPSSIGTSGFTTNQRGTCPMGP